MRQMNELIRIFTFLKNRIANLKNIPKLKEFGYRIYNKIWFFDTLFEKIYSDISKNLNNFLFINSNRLNFFFKNKEVEKANIIKNLKEEYFFENLIKITDTEEFLFLEDHFNNKKPWHDSKHFDIFKEKKKFNRNLVESNQKLDFFNLLSFLDKIYDIFKTKPNYIDKIGIIKVAIDKDGEFILIKGIFLASITKLLNLKEVKVKVILRHSKWLKFRKKFLLYQIVENLYQPLIHPDLESLQSQYSENRFNLFKEYITLNKGKVLDIGANLGYFCHKFEDLGFDCYALELNNKNVYYMEILRKIENKKFRIINKSLFDLNGNLEFDIVIALNIFHHFLKTKYTFIQLENFLNKVNTKIMFFQAHNPKETQMINSYVNFNPQQFVDFIIKKSSLNKYELISSSPDQKGRALYKIYI